TLVPVLELLGELDDDGVEDVPHPVLLLQVPGEGAQVHPDLVRRDAGAPLVVDGVRHVPHESAAAVGTRPDRFARGALHRIADEADGTDAHFCASCCACSGCCVCCACPSCSVPRIRWVTSTHGTTVRSTVQPAATARPKTLTTEAISSSVSPSSGSCTSSAIER